jgi:transcriptional regulator with XRE-family HTH domain
MTRYAMPARQRLIGWHLRDYRESAGYDLADAARILECNRSKISRIETGQRGIHPSELHELLTEYGARPAVAEALAALARPHRNRDGWWTGCASMLPEPYLEFAATEATASAIMTYAPVQVPELLQTPAYASAAAAVDASKPQRRETALAAAVLPAQLSHLAELAKHRQHVTIRLLPFTSGLSPAGGTGGFSVLQLGPAAALGIAYAPGPDGASFPPTRMPRPDTCERSITCAHSRSARKPPPASSSNSRESAGRSTASAARGARPGALGGRRGWPNQRIRVLSAGLLGLKNRQQAVGPVVLGLRYQHGGHFVIFQQARHPPHAHPKVLDAACVRGQVDHYGRQRECQRPALVGSQVGRGHLGLKRPQVTDRCREGVQACDLMQ